MIFMVTYIYKTKLQMQNLLCYCCKGLCGAVVQIFTNLKESPKNCFVADFSLCKYVSAEDCLVQTGLAFSKWTAKAT